MKEAERERIARDLHDELGSRLSAIKMAVTQFGRRQSSHDTTLQKQMQYVTQLVDDAIDAMRDIIDDLHPTVLDLGLPAALEWLAQVFTRHTGMKYRLLGDDDLPEERRVGRHRQGANAVLVHCVACGATKAPAGLDTVCACHVSAPKRRRSCPASSCHEPHAKLMRRPCIR